MGIVIETGEAVVPAILIVTVGSVVAHAISKGYRIRLKRRPGKPWENW